MPDLPDLHDMPVLNFKFHQIMTNSFKNKSKFVPVTEVKEYIEKGWNYGRIDEQKTSRENNEI